MKPNKFRYLILIVLGVLLGLGQAAQANLTAVGPIDPADGFPVWYQDANTLALIPCHSQTKNAAGAPMCVLFADAGFNPALPMVFPINYPGEAFYWIANAFAPLGSPFATYVKVIEFALEKSFANIAGTPTPGEQTVFARIRIRIDPPITGTYTVTHPFGVKVYPNALAGAKGINDTIDVPLGAPLDFTGALNGGIGPFLRWPDGSYPITIGGERFIGDPNVAHTVTGSPTAFNKVRVDGPAEAFGGASFVETDLFLVAGSVFNGNLPTPISVTRASYSRTAAPSSGQVDVFATSTSTASLTVNAGGVIPDWPMTGDGTGKFFAHIPLADATTLPETLTVTADNSVANPNNIPAQVTVNLQDLVTIATADYNAATGQLTVTAISSDLLVPVPDLTPAGFTTPPTFLLAGVPTSFATAAPPASITVSSSKGGSDTQNVTVAAVSPAVLLPVARNDSAHTLPITSVDIPVLANDLALVGTLNTGSVLIGTDPTNGTVQVNTPVAGQIRYTPNALFSGVDTFTYTVIDNQPQTSLPATVTVTVRAAPVAVNDTAVTNQNALIVINILANDIVATGLFLNPASVIPTPAAHGTISVNPSTGVVTYTPTTGYVGPDSFTYTVKDNLGVISNTATVTITVLTLGPVANPDTAFTAQGQPVTISVLANDFGGNAQLNPTTVRVVSPPIVGSAVANTLNGTIIYTPPVSFTGQVTFTYDVKNFLNIISNPATVTVTVSPLLTEQITVSNADFNSRLRLWTIAGKTTAVPPPNNSMTIRAGSLGGTLLGTAAVDATGNWVFNQVNSAVPFNATISVQSSYGTAVTGPVILR